MHSSCPLKKGEQTIEDLPGRASKHHSRCRTKFQEQRRPRLQPEYRSAHWVNFQIHWERSLL